MWLLGGCEEGGEIHVGGGKGLYNWVLRGICGVWRGRMWRGTVGCVRREGDAWTYMYGLIKSAKVGGGSTYVLLLICMQTYLE